MPKMNILLGIAIALIIVIAGSSAQNDSRQFRICIPLNHLGACEQMQKDGNPNSQKIKCVTANDKIGCIEKIVKDEADFMALEPEEIYVAHTFKQNAFAVITEIRTAEFQERNYRYEPVAVIRKSSGINSISDLRGKRSCHTGFGRNAGWKIPFSHLMDKNELPKLCDDIKAPTPERDLYAISNYFGEVCAPGSWVTEQFKDRELKEKYTNLCSLCENPLTCAKDDKYGGYEGALKCLTLKNADIAWTKMDAVQRFFRLNESSPSPNIGDYNFLCWDGSSVPLTSKNACSWAKRPWRAILASKRLSAESIADLQNQITLLHKIAQETANITNIIPTWLKSVLEFDRSESGDFDVAFHHEAHIAKQLSPSVYLDKDKNYTVTIEKPSCATKNTIKFCVRSEVEQQKCAALKLASLGRRILPRFECVLAQNTLDCMQKVKNGEADVVNLDPKDAGWAKRNDYNLVPILSEMEKINVEKGADGAPYRYAVAVIRLDAVSSFRNISDLRGKKSCHGSIKSLAGWNTPLGTLRDLKEISGPTCGLSIEIIKYFGNKTCVPGARDKDLKMDWIPQSACSLCAGDGPGPGKPLSPETHCVDTSAERYQGDVGALMCLQDKVADVAFMDHVGLNLKGLEGRELSLKADDLMLLCPSGKTMELAHYQHCNWGKVPSRKIVTRGGDENLVEREDARLTLLKVSDTFGPNGKSESVLKLFGPYFGNSDLLFQDTSIGLCDEAVAKNEINENLISDFDYCTTSSVTRLISQNYSFYFIITFMSYLAVNWSR